MKSLLVSMLCMISHAAKAGVTAIVIAFGNGDVPVNTYIDVDAEYVAMSVSLSSDAKYPSERAKLINQLQSAIEGKAKIDTSIVLQQGSVSLSPREQSSFSISKSYGSSNGSNLYLLTPLVNNSSIYDATQKLNNFIISIKKPDDTEIRLGNTSLAIAEPNRYRLDLLIKIKSEIESTKASMASNYKASISGLEGAVLVKQLNDKQVRLFIDYSFKLSE